MKKKKIERVDVVENEIRNLIAEVSELKKEVGITKGNYVEELTTCSSTIIWLSGTRIDRLEDTVSGLCKSVDKIEKEIRKPLYKKVFDSFRGVIVRLFGGRIE